MLSGNPIARLLGRAVPGRDHNGLVDLTTLLASQILLMDHVLEVCYLALNQFVRVALVLVRRELLLLRISQLSALPEDVGQFGVLSS